MLVAEVVDGLRRAEPADPLDLEVDDPPGTALDRLGGPFQALGRLVEADRRVDGPLQVGQAVEVVGGHRLLDHQQVVLVELAEDVEIGGGIGTVGVDHRAGCRRYAGGPPGRARCPGRADLDLDPAIAGLEVGSRSS